MSAILHGEVVIIGAGPGGYAAAFRAADLGKQVILIDKNAELGGVCLDHGCIPSKALLHITKVIEDAKTLKKSGITFGEPKLDLDIIRSWKESVVDKLNKGIYQLAKARNVQVIQGTASFVSPTQILVKNNRGSQSITFNNSIIATGSRSSSIPGISNNHPRSINSTGALQLPEIPKRLLVIGGGYIGLEMGSVYNTLGSQVTVVECMPSLLSGVDEDLVKPLAKKLSQSFENIYLSTKVAKMVPTTTEVTLYFERLDGKGFNIHWKKTKYY